MLEFTTLHARMAAATAITLVSRAASDTFPCSCETIRDGSHIPRKVAVMPGTTARNWK